MNGRRAAPGYHTKIKSCFARFRTRMDLEFLFVELPGFKPNNRTEKTA
jgi:hypothetical protein